MQPPVAKPLILVVDDIIRNIQVVGTVLCKEGYEVMPAASGAEALKCVHAQLPDLILLDLMMPEMDGLEVCRRLMAEAATSQVPVVFLTASNEMEHLVKGFEMGAVDYVTKPFNPPELLARVRTHLELERQRLREMNEEKNEFMGIAAHDLKNPLSAIQGYAEMILEDARALKSGKQVATPTGRPSWRRTGRGYMKPPTAWPRWFGTFSTRTELSAARCN